MNLHNFSVRQLYFFLVSFISLLIVLFSLQTFLTTVLRSYILKTAPDYTYAPPLFPFSYSPNVRIKMMPTEFEENKTQEQKNEEFLLALRNNQTLTEEQRSSIDQWFSSYSNWKMDQDNINKQIIDSLISNIIALLIFTPVFAYHFKKALNSQGK